MPFTAHKRKSTEGYKPSKHLDLATSTAKARPTQTQSKAEKRRILAESEARPTKANESEGRSGSKGESEGKRDAKRRQERVGPGGGAPGGGAAGGYGGQRGRQPGRGKMARGPLTQTRSGFVVGDEVRNASGRGVWGLGTIIGVIPADVNPRWYCRHKGLPMLFDRRSERMGRERFIVLGDDGRYHVPRKVEGV